MTDIAAEADTPTQAFELSSMMLKAKERVFTEFADYAATTLSVDGIEALLNNPDTRLIFRDESLSYIEAVINLAVSNVTNPEEEKRAIAIIELIHNAVRLYPDLINSTSYALGRKGYADLAFPCAISGGYLDLAKLLGDLGADPNKSGEDEPPAHSAVYNATDLGDEIALKELKLLADLGADFETSHHGVTAIELADEEKFTEGAEFMRRVMADRRAALANQPPANAAKLAPAPKG